ncbi:MAG: hypothetical protein RIB93_20845 [Coleofasciculus sp. D1-CHI-01]|uniref:hypothetical protein n=1 Tax=Coleofasciculus sp. D1-CHI-01 TaxID=3068482 RepID=UPI0032FB1E31
MRSHSVYPHFDRQAIALSPINPTQTAIVLFLSLIRLTGDRTSIFFYPFLR